MIFINNEIKNNEIANLTLSRLEKVKRKGMDRLIDYLINKADYLTAPASTNFHGNYEGGLIEHCNYVVNLLYEKNKRYELGIPDESIIICGLLHDICKCDFYDRSVKWVKENKEWKAYLRYSVEDTMPLGHGAKSVIILQDFIKLTELEKYLIMWHMYTNDLSDYNKYTLNNAVELYPAIVAMYTADLEASTYFEKKVDLLEISNEEANRIQAEKKKKAEEKKRCS